MKKNTTFSHKYQQKGKQLPRTDLACETIDINSPAKGTEYEEYTLSTLNVSSLKVTSPEGENSTGKKMGSYVTLHCPVMKDLCEEDEFSITDAVSMLLKDMCEKITNKKIGPDTRVLVAGLGNRFISADSIGPRTADKITVTGHMKMTPHSHLFDLIGCAQISAVHPGVMGQTGIEAVAMIKGAADYVKPHIVIAVDALASRATSRLCSTVQLCDTGIAPGSGIGNRRGSVCKETVGYPVIAIGVPTVVDCATLVYDTLERAGIERIDDSLAEVLSGEKDFFVSPKDTDVLSEEISRILSKAINRTFNCEGL